MLRAKTIQKRFEICQANSQQSQILRTWRNVGDERSDAELSWAQRGSLRLCAARPPQRSQVSCVLACLRPFTTLRQKVRRSHQMLSKRFEMGAGKYTNSERPFIVASADARLGRL